MYLQVNERMGSSSSLRHCCSRLQVRDIVHGKHALQTVPFGHLRRDFATVASHLACRKAPYSDGESNYTTTFPEPQKQSCGNQAGNVKICQHRGIVCTAASFPTCPDASKLTGQ